MVFKRRDRRSILRIVANFFYPRGGWARAFEYVKHRVRRLPDTPEKISRGVWAGVLASFTPFYGIHFFIAALVAWAMRGNVFAALTATFFGNPLTYVPIAISALSTGHFILGTKPSGPLESTLGAKFAGAGHDLWHNFMAMFTPQTAEWGSLSVFYQEVFYPYMIGGVVSGVFVATVCYCIMLPLLRGHQKRRQKKLSAKLERLKKNPVNQDDGGQ